MRVWVFFFSLCACYFCRSLSFATNALYRKPRINQVARFVVIVSCIFVHFSTLTSGANARLRFFWVHMRVLFLHMREFCDACDISKPTPPSFCTLRRYFCMRFRVFCNPNAWCKCASSSFFTLVRILFLKIRKFCDECVISKHAQTSDCTFRCYFWLRMRVFFQP